MTRTKRRTFNKFLPYYLKIGLLFALFRFPHRETLAHVREFALSIMRFVREFDDVYYIHYYVAIKISQKLYIFSAIITKLIIDLALL